jgi:drug/metabolite transporter (DMT)-like permease
MERVGSRVGYLYVLAAGCMWGTTGVFAKWAYSLEVNAFQLAFLRPFIALMMIGGYLALSRKGFHRIKLRHLPLLAGLGLANVTAFSLAYFYTLQATTITQAVFLLYTMPIFAVVLARLLLAEPLVAPKVLALIASVLGIVLLTNIHLPGRMNISYTAILTGIGSALSYAMSRVLGKIALRIYPLRAVVFYSLALGTSFLFLIIRPQHFLLEISGRAWLVSAAMSLVTAVLATVCAFMGLQRIEASRASIVATIQPVVASLLGFILFGELLNISGLAGASLILLGAVLVQF